VEVFLRKISILLFLACGGGLGFSRCGINTDTPVAPFVFLVPVAVPQIFSVRPSTSNTNEEGLQIGFDPTAKPEFFLSYFVTNREPQFIGYNLYITASVPSVAETLIGEYLEDGIPPSFPHLPIEASTEKKDLVTRKVRNFIPPPGLVPFQRCQIYTFSFRAFLNSGIVSNQSTPVSACSSIRPSLCPLGSGCNPEICAIPNCGSPSVCPVGTVCNPCRNGESELESGCKCRDGQEPPGCYR